MAKLAFVWVYKFFSKLNNLKPYRWMSTPSIANQCFVLLKKNVTSIIFSQQNLDEKLLLVGG